MILIPDTYLISGFDSPEIKSQFIEVLRKTPTMAASVYIRLKTSFMMAEEDIAELDEFERLTQETEWIGYEYVKISGECPVNRFYDDTEGGITINYGYDIIHYDITAREFIDQSAGLIKVIE